MNKDQVKGAVKEAAGKVQTQLGKLTGNTEQKVKGKVLTAEGKSQQVLGDAKELVKDMVRKP